MIAVSPRPLAVERGFACRLCGATDEPIDLGPNGDFPLAGGEGARSVRCRCCSLRGTRPLPDARQLAEAYREAYRGRRQEGPDEGYLKESDARAAAQWAFVDRAASKQVDAGSGTPCNFSGARILDVGCAAGSFLCARLDESASLTGFEPDRAMWEAAGRRLGPRAQLFNSIFDAQEMSGRRFDVIAASHVLEHVLEPIVFLKRLLGVLEDGGVLFLEVPNEDAGTIAAGTGTASLGRMHLYFFDPQRLRAAAEAAGGVVVALGAFGDPKVHPRPSSEPSRVGGGWISRLRSSGHPAVSVARAVYRTRRLQKRRKRMFVEREDGDCLRVIAMKQAPDSL